MMIAILIKAQFLRVVPSSGVSHEVLVATVGRDGEYHTYPRVREGIIAV
jgi:hypothetical protein